MMRDLVKAARLVDLGTLRSTITQHFGDITAEHLRRAHQLQESGTAMGKTVLGI